MLNALFAPLLIRMQDNFRVGSGLEPVAKRFELEANFLEIVDFSIERDAKIAITHLHWLVAELGDIEYRQPSAAEANYGSLLDWPFIRVVNNLESSPRPLSRESKSKTAWSAVVNKLRHGNQLLRKEAV